MAANRDDLFKKMGNPGTATTLSAPGYTAGGTSMTVGSTTNWPTDTGVCFSVYETEVVGNETVMIDGTYNEYNAIVSSATSLTTVEHVTGSGTDRDYAAGATTVVTLLFSAGRENDLITGLTAEHSQLAGTHTDITTDSINNAGVLTQTGVATFANHIDVNDSSTAIRDSSDNELLKFAKTASAVNELTITNAATGAGASLSATGGDTNIDLNLTPKGTGKLKVGGNTIEHGAWTDWTPTWTNLTTGNGTLNWAKYCQVGKTVFFRLKFTLGTTSSVGTTPTFTLPVTSSSSYESLGSALGPLATRDVSGSASFFGMVYWNSTTTAAPATYGVSGSLLGRNTFTSTVPFTWANTDYIECSGSYEAA